MAELEPPLYLFDEYALEGALSDGSDTDHKKISGWENGTLCLTKAVKDKFLNAFPEERENLSVFHIARKNTTDNVIAASYGDQLQNLPDFDSRPVQSKILLIAMTFRLGATLVTAEEIGLTTWIKSLADQLEVPCITLDQFMAL